MLFRNVILGVLLSGAATGAYAQVAPATQADGAEAENVGEIIVTAQRRAESLTEVPLSIQALSEETLVATGIREVRGLQYTTPGFSSTVGVGFTQLYIRGIGNNIFIGADPSVATFVDDVPRVYANMVNDFVNVERVEVLKGAQGGLYGRNATAGVINIITKQPSDEAAMQARVSYGSHNTIEAAGYVNLPISEGVAANLAVTRKYHDPYVNNLAVANPFPAGSPVESLNAVNNRRTRVNDADVWSVDGKLRADLGDNLKVTFAGDYTSKRDAEGIAGVNRQPQLAYNLYRVFLAGRFGQATTDSVAPPGGAFPNPARKFDVYYAGDARNYLKDYGGSAKVELELDGVDLTSITAMRWNSTDFYQQNGYTPVVAIATATAYAKKNFYQELRAVSTGDGPLRWLGGVTYFRDRIDSSIIVYSLGFRNPPSTDTLSTLRTRSWSAYGQLEYDLTDALTLTGSLRYIHEKKSAVFPFLDQPGATPDFPEVRGSNTVKRLLPSATLSYDTGDGTLYARYARGFKTGGINPIARPNFFPTAEGSQFSGEQVDTFEIGYRAQLFDNKVMLTTAAFYNKLKDLQVSRGGRSGAQPIQLIYLNAGSARTYGAEASLAWKVAPPLTLSGGVGYLNAKYQTFESAGIPVIGLAPFDASGMQMILAPKWQANASVNLDQPIGPDLRIAGNLLYSYTSATQFDERNLPETGQGGYSLVNGRIGVVTADDRFGAYLFANNIFNKYYYAYISGRAFGVGGQPGAPRVIGGTIEMKF